MRLPFMPQNSDTVHRYTTILEKYGGPGSIELELTETATVSDYDHVKQLFAKLQTVGFRTALDDFGAGYSILNTVIDIPVNTVKVDRAFISNCETTHKGIYFLREIINLLKGLGYHIVCEGVETPEQASILRNTMCDEVQGYWFSHPVPAHEFEKMLQEGGSREYYLRRFLQPCYSFYNFLYNSRSCPFPGK